MRRYSSHDKKPIHTRMKLKLKENWDFFVSEFSMTFSCWIRLILMNIVHCNSSDVIFVSFEKVLIVQIIYLLIICNTFFMPLNVFSHSFWKSYSWHFELEVNTKFIRPFLKNCLVQTSTKFIIDFFRRSLFWINWIASRCVLTILNRILSLVVFQIVL